MQMTPLVLLPGMMCDQRLFAPQISAFKEERLVQVVDISRADSMSAIASQVLDQAPDVFALAGLSLGGIVAMEILRQAPQRVERLALLDTNPRAELIDVQVNRNRQIQCVQNGELHRLMHCEMFPHYLAQSLPAINAQNILSLCSDMAMSLGGAAFIRQSRALQNRIDQQQVLSQYRRPSLVLMGNEDTLCPLDRHQLMHTLLADSTLVVIDQAGHLTTLEQPEAVNLALKNWLHAQAKY